MEGAPFERAEDPQMIEVHHLNNSRSQRILWLLEELELDYEIVKYQRDAETNLAPESLREIHPLGKSPVVREDGTILFESAAIIDHLVRRYGNGRLAPPESSREHVRYQQWLHYAEGSAMLPLMLKLYLGRLGDAAGPLLPRVEDEIQNHMGYLDSQLADSDFFLGNDLTAADVALSFPIQATRVLYGIDSFPNLAGFLERIVARPAYRRAIERGGPYVF
jgi:glutathione S-transferase